MIVNTRLLISLLLGFLLTASISGSITINKERAPLGTTEAVFTRQIVKRTIPPQSPIISLGSNNNAALFLNAALANLNYLPVSFSFNYTAAGKTLDQRWALAATFSQPIDGKFNWKYPDLEGFLAHDWSPNTFSVVTEGALITYQQHKELVVDGIAGPQVFAALKRDLLANKTNPNNYLYVTVEQQQPESLTVWRNGKKIFVSPANTGIASAPTANGTWPIYLRYKTQTMQGITPSGEHYSDPGVPNVSYFHGGDAIHGFWRTAYGSPQSLGCVELPVKNAESVYNLVTLGTLVTVRK